MVRCKIFMPLYKHIPCKDLIWCFYCYPSHNHSINIRCTLTNDAKIEIFNVNCLWKNLIVFYLFTIVYILGVVISDVHKKQHCNLSTKIFVTFSREFNIKTYFLSTMFISWNNFALYLLYNTDAEG